MRVCARCHQEKALSDFWRQSSRRDGYQAACIECMSKSHKRWRANLDCRRKADMHSRNAESVKRCRQRDPLGLMYRSIKARAKKAGLECTIKKEDIVIPTHCPVLGIPLAFGVRRGKGLAERDQRPSVDRIDNSRGYTPDNIVIVSYRANRIKSDATLREIESIARFYRGLDEDRIRNSDERGHTHKALVGELSKNGLPDVFREQKKETRPVLERHEDKRGDLSVLSPLLVEFRGVIR